MELSARIATLELRETFVISREARDAEDVLWVEIEHDGVTGHGEAAPIERYDQTAASACAYVDANGGALGEGKVVRNGRESCQDARAGVPKARIQALRRP